jgi:GxxExxY protein
MDLIHAETTGPLIKLFFEVYCALGYGFLENVYANAMAVAGRKKGMDIRLNVPIRVGFEGVIIGRYQADMVVNNSVIAELKACRGLLPEHEAQLLNYLKATTYEVGILFNFGPRARYKRMVFENARKGRLDWSR